MLKRLAHLSLLKLRGAIRGSRFDPGIEMLHAWTARTQASSVEEYRPYWFFDDIRREQVDAVNILGLFSAELGLGEAARRLARSIWTTDYPCSTTTVSLPHIFQETIEFDARQSALVNAANALLFFNADTLIELLRANQLPLDQILGRRRIGFWHWE